jgi:hypothetical protein
MWWCLGGDRTAYFVDCIIRELFPGIAADMEFDIESEDAPLYSGRSECLFRLF